jgi:hypothetical protein
VGEYLEVEILKARPNNGQEAEAAMKRAIQGRWEEFDTVDAFRSDDHVAEIDFVAVNCGRYTKRVSLVT